MSKTEHLRGQHNDMAKIIGEISSKLSVEYCKTNPSEISHKLASLIGKLKIHLSSEDKALYPTLLASTDPKVKTTAEAFMKEMGGIAPSVEAYFTKWALASHIQKNPEDFIKETKDLFAALAKRIDREHKDLYPLLDAA